MAKRWPVVLAVALNVLLVVVVVGAVGDALEEEPRTVPGTPRAAGDRVPELAPRWTAPMPTTDPESTELIGQWADGQRVVRGQPDGLVAFEAGGAVAWSLPAGADVRFCGMSGRTEAGLGLVTFGGLEGGETHACNQLHAVDLATGVPRWTARWEPSNGDRFGTTLRPEVSAGVAVVPDDRAGGFAGYDLATGAPRWTYDDSADNPVAAPTGQPGSCVTAGLAAGPRSLLLLAGCSPQAFVIGDEITVVRALDPVTGLPRWSVPLPPETAPRVPGVVLDALTAEPPTMSVGEIEGRSTVLVLDEVTGAVQRELRLGGRIAVDDGASSADTAPHVLVDGPRIFLRTVTDPPEGVSCGNGLAVVAIDVTAGEVDWSSGRDRPACSRALAGVSGGALLVVEDIDPVGPARLFRYPVDGSERSTVGNLAWPREPRPLSGVARTAGDEVVLLPGDARDSEHAALGFGPVPG